MSRETKDLSLFEQMGGTYFEKDGLLYPIFLTKQMWNRLRLESMDYFGFLL